MIHAEEQSWLRAGSSVQAEGPGAWQRQLERYESILAAIAESAQPFCIDILEIDPRRLVGSIEAGVRGWTESLTASLPTNESSREIMTVG